MKPKENERLSLGVDPDFVGLKSHTIWGVLSKKNNNTMLIQIKRGVLELKIHWFHNKYIYVCYLCY